MSMSATGVLIAAFACLGAGAIAVRDYSLSGFNTLSVDSTTQSQEIVVTTTSGVWLADEGATQLEEVEMSGPSFNPAEVDAVAVIFPSDTIAVCERLSLSTGVIRLGGGAAASQPDFATTVYPVKWPEASSSLHACRGLTYLRSTNQLVFTSDNPNAVHIKDLDLGNADFSQWLGESSLVISSVSFGQATQLLDQLGPLAASTTSPTVYVSAHLAGDYVIWEIDIQSCVRSSDRLTDCTGVPLSLSGILSAGQKLVSLCVAEPGLLVGVTSGGDVLQYNSKNPTAVEWLLGDGTGNSGQGASDCSVSLNNTILVAMSTGPDVGIKELISKPATDAPPTSSPMTPVPPTPLPPTGSPWTPLPPTVAPTQSPSTLSPPTHPPGTAAPTSVPPTSVPPTSVPLTTEPVTSAPITQAPTPAPTAVPVDPQVSAETVVVWELAGADTPEVGSQVLEEGLSIVVRLQGPDEFQIPVPNDAVRIEAINSPSSRGIAWALQNASPLHIVRALNSKEIEIVIGPIPDFRAGLAETVGVVLMPQATVHMSSSRFTFTVKDTPHMPPGTETLQVLSIAAVGPANQLLLYSDLNCGSGEEPELGLTFHPVGYFFPQLKEVDGSACLGAVLGNTTILVVLSVLHAVLVLLWSRRTDDFASQGAMRFPAATLLLYLFLYQGCVLCGVRLLLYPHHTWHGVVGGVSTALNTFLPLLVARTIWLAVPSKARYRVPDGEKQPRLRVFFLGRGEWVSKCRQNPFVNRFTVILKSYTERHAWYALGEFCLMFFSGAAVAVQQTSYSHCGIVRLFCALFNAVYLVLEVMLWPHCRPRDVLLDSLRLGLQAAGLISIAIAFLMHNTKHSLMTVGTDLFFAALVVLLIKLVLDFICWTYVTCTGRWRNAQEAEWAEEVFEEEDGQVELQEVENEEELEEALLSPRRSQRGSRRVSLHWEGLMQDMAKDGGAWKELCSDVRPSPTGSFRATSLPLRSIEGSTPSDSSREYVPPV